MPYLPSPKVQEGLVLIIGGFDIPVSGLGWQMIKDTLRIIVHPESKKKPGMVHVYLAWDRMNFKFKEMNKEEYAAHGGSSNPDNTKSQTWVAQINLKTVEAAWTAFRTMAGHRLWGRTLTAAIHRPGEKRALYESNKPENGQEPIDLDKKYAIVSPNGEWTWGRDSAGKVTKMEVKGRNPRKRQVSWEPPSPRKRARMTSPRKASTGIHSIGKDQEKGYTDASPVQSTCVGTSPGVRYEQHPFNALIQDSYNGQWFEVSNGTWYPVYTHIAE